MLRPALARVVEILQPLNVRADRLTASETFAGLPRDQLLFLAGHMRETLIPRGARLTVQGKPCGRLWIILEGQALVSADARPLRVANPGDLIGLAGMLHRTRSVETTIALSPIRAFEVDPNRFELLRANAAIRAKLTAAAGRVSRPSSPRRRSSAAV